MVWFKRLHWFMLKTFLPLFAMTFFIVLFIVLMQFLWRYINDLVEKKCARFGPQFLEEINKFING